MPLSNYGVPLADIYKNVEAIKAARNANSLDQYKMQDIERVNQERQTLADLYKQNPNDLSKIPSAAAAAGLGSQVPAMTSAIGAAQEATATAGTSQMNQVAQAAHAIDPSNPNAMVEFKQTLARLKANPDMIKAIPDSVSPEEIAKLKKGLESTGVSELQAQTLEVNKAKAAATAGNVSDYKDIKVTEDGRLIGRKKGTGVYEYLEMPGNARATQAPIMYDTGQGVMPMDRKTALDIARSGTKLEKLEQVPAKIAEGYANNNVAIKKLDLLLDATNQKPTKEVLQRLKENKVQWDKDAFGMKTLTPGIILNRTDPSGIDVRAIAADLGSMKIHERSGAAVTASEFPRLKPFIPSAGDDSATVRRKIEGFKREYKFVQDEINNVYSRERGFVPLDGQDKNNDKNNTDSWEDEQYLYRRLSDGTVQRKAK